VDALTPRQIALLQRLLERGFQPVVLPLYPNAVGIRRGAFAALLEPDGAGGFRQIGPPFYMIEGNLSVRLSQGNGEWFVWKSRKVEATPELLAGLAQFASEVGVALAPTG
jgi:hypothetical protein